MFLLIDVWVLADAIWDMIWDPPITVCYLCVGLVVRLTVCGVVMMDDG